MKYIALKPCRFGGNDYQKNDVIPSDSVEQSRLNHLKRMGFIAVVEEAADEQEHKAASGRKGRK